MEQLAENIWVFEGDTVRFYSLPYPTRMTVVRLANGDLWVHSPITLSATLQNEVDHLGPVRYLIAPNHLHHLFLAEWLANYPKALAYGTDEVIKKCSDVNFEGSLNAQQRFPWQDDLKQEMFTGSPLMQECVFFHNHSQTLIVTDLVENFARHQLNTWQRWIARYVGILAPHGKTPLDWRLSFIFHKKVARQHFNTMQSWRPKRLVMAHGEIVYDEAEQFLEKSFSWLT